MAKNDTPTPMRDYFHATGAELREWVDDPAAVAEIARRSAKKAAKKAAAAA